MESGRFAAFSVLLLLLWGGTGLVWAFRVANDRARRVSTLVMAGFALAFGPFAFSKNGGAPPLRSVRSDGEPVATLFLAEVRTNTVFDLTMPSNAIVHGPWLRRGASDDWFWHHAADGFFRVGTNDVCSIRVASRGTLAFPDGSFLEPFHAVLGILPEPNWTNAPSRVWHAPAPGGGRLFTWENAALGRDPATPVSFQTELRPNGDWIGRYELPHPATDFAIAAFGETAWSVRGGATNAATVRRVEGAGVPETSLAELLRDATRFELVWRATDGNPDVDPDGDGLSTRDELRVHGTDPRQADTDGDGLSDAAEILLGSNPLDADEDDDGVPDGIDPAAWAANPLWATNGTGNIVVSLVEAISANAAATFQIGDLAIPLREPATWTFDLDPGTVYDYRLFVSGGATAHLAITNEVPAPALRGGPLRAPVPWGSPIPLWDRGTGGVFDGPSPGGEGEMAIPVLSLLWDDPQDGSHRVGTDICLHGSTEARFSKSLLPLIADSWVLHGLSEDGDELVLSVPRDGETFFGEAELDPSALRFGSVRATASAHRCDASFDSPFCSIRGHYEPEDVSLSVSSTVLTLKHDNELRLSVDHPNSPTVPFEDVSFEIRRSGVGCEWHPLEPAANSDSWTARVPGHFELRARGQAGGRNFETTCATLEVRFPGLADIIADLDVQSRMLTSWELTKQDCTEVPNQRREHGFWIQLDTVADSYHCTDEITGRWVVPGEQGGITNSPPADTDPFDLAPTASGGTFNVCAFHTHTPTTYLDFGRQVGPSQGDREIALSRGIPSLVYDYKATAIFNGRPVIPDQHPKESTARAYPVSPPSRRATP